MQMLHVRLKKISHLRYVTCVILARW